MGSDEGHFNASLFIVRDKVTRQCPQTTTRARRAEAESNRGPSAYQSSALPLGQDGSQGLIDYLRQTLLPDTDLVT